MPGWTYSTYLHESVFVNLIVYTLNMGQKGIKIVTFQMQFILRIQDNIIVVKDSFQKDIIQLTEMTKFISIIETLLFIMLLFLQSNCFQKRNKTNEQTTC